ncbi:MAG: GIY-YIG nuclease family protein [Faecalibacterium sp.]
MAASEKPEKTAYVYMVRCAGGQLYTGWTNDPEARLKAHQSGKGASIPAPIPRWALPTWKRVRTSLPPSGGRSPSKS